MPKPNLNFTRGLTSTIITMLGSTQPKHLNAKTLLTSFFVPNLRGYKISNVVQKFPKKQMWWTR
jgi:hypothetical protein